jgi:hypothetical protein
MARKINRNLQEEEVRDIKLVGTSRRKRPEAGTMS